PQPLEVSCTFSRYFWLSVLAASTGHYGSLEMISQALWIICNENYQFLAISNDAGSGQLPGFIGIHHGLPTRVNAAQ
ncbi:MAG: hypothetical protein AAF827_20325, partial [Cyanobacteria bacterium P01_D01_bin.6]